MDEFQLVARADEMLSGATIRHVVAGRSTDLGCLSAQALDDAIASFGEARQHLRDEVPREVDGPHMRMPQIEDPVWRAPAGRVNGCRVLALRHPAFGWTAFLFPEHEARAIADWLTRDLPDQG
jgi:hypothetical protein